MSVLIKFQEWYWSNCDGDWEHQYGVELGTLDNPGWRLVVDTSACENVVENFSIVVDRSEDDWIHAWSKEGVFEAAAGPRNLEEMLSIFLQKALIEDNSAGRKSR